MHFRMQAIMRDNWFPEDELMYLGEREGQHWYLIAGEHEVPIEDITGIEDESEE